MELKVEETWEATRMRRGRKGKDRGTRHGKEKRQKRKGGGRGRRERQKGRGRGKACKGQLWKWWKQIKGRGNTHDT
jgi:hypothetical protein